MLRAGQVVKAQVLAIDTEKRQIKLSMKQLIPTSIDEYIAEHKAGDVVSGRVVEESSGRAHGGIGRGHSAAAARATRLPAINAVNAEARRARPIFFALVDAAGAMEGKCTGSAAEA